MDPHAHTRPWGREGRTVQAMTVTGRIARGCGRGNRSSAALQVDLPSHGRWPRSTETERALEVADVRLSTGRTAVENLFQVVDMHRGVSSADRRQIDAHR